MNNMNRVLLLTMLILGLTIVVACGSGNDDSQEEPEAATEEEVPAGDAENGGEIYSTTCIGCHGPGGTGVEGLGKDLRVSTFVAENSTEDLVDFLKIGRPISDPLNSSGVDMPPKGGNPSLSDQDLLDIVAYMQSIQQ